MLDRNSLFKGNLLLVFIVCISIGFSTVSKAQSNLKPLIDYFPSMPNEMSNDQFRAMTESSSTNKIALEYYPTLQVSDQDKIVKAIGKVESKKAIILFYAEIDLAYHDDRKELLSMHMVLVDKKNSSFMDGSTQRYIAMSGEDAKYHESSFIFKNNKLIVKTKESTSQDSSSSTEETVIYKIGKKTLEYVETN